MVNGSWLMVDGSRALPQPLWAGVGMLRGRGVLGFLVSWYLGFMISWFLRFLVSWFQSVFVSWFQSFLASKFLGIRFSWFRSLLVSLFQSSMIQYYPLHVFRKMLMSHSSFSRFIKTDFHDCSVPVFSEIVKSVDLPNFGIKLNSILQRRSIS